MRMKRTGFNFMPGFETASLILLLVIFSGCSGPGMDTGKDDLSEALESLDILNESYWNENLAMFNNSYPCNDCNDQFHYWWQAHGLDVLLDGLELTGHTRFSDQVDVLYHGLLQRNGGDLFNNYYDDMLWMGLALHRAYSLTKNKVYLTRSIDLWEHVIEAWNEEFGGGIPWRTTQIDYKNTPSNAPAVILSSRLFTETGDEAYLAWAEKIYSWLKDTLVDPETGLVWDGVNRQGDGGIDKNWMFTYNQGTFTGAAIELWKATGEEGYLGDARRNVDASLEELTDSNGIFMEDGQGDGGLFKGILIRYFVDFDRAVEGDTGVRKMLHDNAEAVWDSRTADGLFGPDWRQTHDGQIDLSTHLSGVKLIVLSSKIMSTGPG